MEKELKTDNSKIFERLRSACTSSMEFSDRRKRESLSSCFTIDRLSENPQPLNGFLSLAFEELTQIPLGQISDQLLNSVHTLDVSTNRISDVKFLCEFEKLTTLNLDRNRLDCSTTFPKMPDLQWLSINYNRIEDMTPFISALAVQCPNLRFLSLMGNDVCPNYLNGGTEQQYELYRQFVLRLFPHLIYLDDSSVTSDERDQLAGCSEFITEVHGSISSVDTGIETG